MKILVVKDYNEMSLKAASMIAGQVVLKPESILGLATGSTVIGMYKKIIEFYNGGMIDFNKVTTFNLDEYYPINHENNNSYHYYMDDNLFKHINVREGYSHVPSGMADDIESECLQYERKIHQAGGLDLQVLGIGRNGHIGFNEPDIKFEARTHKVTLDEQTIQDNSRFFNSIEEVPTHAVSMGIKTIMHAKKVMILASGIEKSEAVHGMVCGKITPSLPASVLQLHPDVTLIVDEEAASKLPIAELELYE